MARDALAGLKRLQVATIGLTLVAAGALAGEWLLRKPAPPAPAAPLDRAAFDAAVGDALATRGPDPAATELRGRLERLEKELQAIAARPPAPAPAAPVQPGSLVKVLREERRYVVRVRQTREGAGTIEWAAAPVAPGADPFQPAEGDRGAAAAYRTIPAGERAARLPLPEPPAADPGLLFVGAIVRADKDATEETGRLVHLRLECTAGGGGSEGDLGPAQVWDLAGAFFPVPARGVRSDDAAYKSAANTAVFAVQPGSRLALLVDADALARRLVGPLEIAVRAGPLVSVREPSGTKERGE